MARKTGRPDMTLMTGRPDRVTVDDEHYPEQTYVYQVMTLGAQHANGTVNDITTNESISGAL